MNTKSKQRRIVFPATVFALALSAVGTVHAATEADPGTVPVVTGSLHGRLQLREGGSAAGVKVAVCKLSDLDCSFVTTNVDGGFKATGLSAGHYEIAMLSGRELTGLVVREVVPGRDVLADLAPGASNADPQTVAPAAAAAPLDQSFMHRLGRAYVADWAGSGPGTAVKQSDRRGTPAPIPSPPYPASDWPIGGTPVIGAPDGQTYPLMQAINENKGVNKIYGWIEVGANGSTNNKTNASKGIAANAPAAYDVYSNTIQLDQAAVYFEKIENTAQNDHIDWGYRVALLYGTDYRFTTSHGLLSQQLLVKNAQYGFDPVMFYYDLYLPHVGQGTVVRVGRYISLPDIEAQLAPNNYTYSHSILYTYDCYTQLGMNVSTKINNNITVQGGISAGCDTMPWTTDAKVTGNVCVTLTVHNGGDAFNTCDNSINDSKYAYNNLTAYYETWYHRFNASWHTDTEGWYQYMKDVPNMYWFNSGGSFANTARTPYPETNGGGVNLNFGAVCTDPKLNANLQPARCYAPEFAIVNYVEHNFWKNTASLNIRNEFMDDIKGQRTGTPAKYEEHMVGFDFWSGSTITFRPEVSYTKCYTKYKTFDGRSISCTDISPGASIASYQSEWAAYGNGGPGAFANAAAAENPTGRGKTSSITVAADLIFHF